MQFFVNFRNIVIGYVTIWPYKPNRENITNISKTFAILPAFTYMLWKHCHFPFSIQLVQCPMEYQLYWTFFVPFHCSTMSNDSDRVAKSCIRQTIDSMIYAEVLSLLYLQLACLKFRNTEFKTFLVKQISRTQLKLYNLIICKNPYFQIERKTKTKIDWTLSEPRYFSN